MRRSQPRSSFLDRPTLSGRPPAAPLAALTLALGLALGAAGCGSEEGQLGLYPYEPDFSEVSEEETNDLIWELLGKQDSDGRTRKRYLDLMKLSLTDLIYESDPVGRRRRVEGWDWPSRGYTMIGLRRLKHIEWCYGQVAGNGVPGDLIEAGAWRGGATILMRALLAAYGDKERTVWVADSFEGMPKPENPNDANLDLSDVEELAVSVEQVKRHFARYGLLDDQVKFLKGWFKDSLPNAPIEQLAILRIDADLYASTTDALTYLYPKLSSGGCLIVDDYWIPACRTAVDDFREANGIEEKLLPIDSEGIFWIKK